MDGENRLSLKANRSKSLGCYNLGVTVGQGAFGSIYKVSREQDGKEFAMKVSKQDKKSSLVAEVKFLGQLQGSPYFPKLIDSGKENNDQYMVMELLGPSLSRLLEFSKTKGLSLSTSLRLGIEMIRAIRAFHELGFVHRDIKPSNFLLRPSRKYPVTLIDYGISKRFRDRETGETIPARSFIGFVGTQRYASIRAHEGKELGRNDDMYSWFVSLIELMTGKTPWKTTKVHKDMIDIKASVDMEKFCSALPRQIIQIYYLVLSMKFGGEPKYDLLIAFLVEAMDENNCKWSDPYDWETFSEKRLKKMSHVNILPPPDEQPIIPTNLPSTKIEIPYQKPIPAAVARTKNVSEDARIPLGRFRHVARSTQLFQIPPDMHSHKPAQKDESDDSSSLTYSMEPFSTSDDEEDSFSDYSDLSDSSFSDDDDTKTSPATPSPQKPSPLVDMSPFKPDKIIIPNSPLAPMKKKHNQPVRRKLPPLPIIPKKTNLSPTPNEMQDEGSPLQSNQPESPTKLVPSNDEDVSAIIVVDATNQPLTATPTSSRRPVSQMHLLPTPHGSQTNQSLTEENDIEEHKNKEEEENKEKPDENEEKSTSSSSSSSSSSKSSKSKEKSESNKQTIDTPTTPKEDKIEIDKKEPNSDKPNEKETNNEEEVKETKDEKEPNTEKPIETETKNEEEVKEKSTKKTKEESNAKQTPKEKSQSKKQPKQEQESTDVNCQCLLI